MKDYVNDRASRERIGYEVALLRVQVQTGFNKSVGFFIGKHYTEHVQDIKQMKRSGKYDAAIERLEALLPVVEREAEVMGWALAPWYYEALAIEFRRRGDLQAERRVLERYFRLQTSVPGATHEALIARLNTVKRKIDQSPK